MLARYPSHYTGIDQWIRGSIKGDGARYPLLNYRDKKSRSMME